MEENNTLTNPSVATAHDDFDWSIDKRNVARYNNDEQQKYDAVYEGTFKTITDGEMVQGTVVGMTKTDVVINIGFKSDGLVSLNEFRDMHGLKTGDVVEVMVVEKEDREGHLHLSRKQARISRAWERIVEMHKTGEVVTGFVTSKTKGGLIVDILGMETFLPGSQIDVKPVTDYDQFVGKTMEFKVVKINEAIKNAVVSHKALIESDIEAQRAEIMGKLEKGQVLEGTIKNITDFGAFLDLGGVDGLLYITDISWGRINHPSEVLKLDQKVNVVVLDFDDEKKIIASGYLFNNTESILNQNEDIKMLGSLRPRFFTISLCTLGVAVAVSATTGMLGLIISIISRSLLYSGRKSCPHCEMQCASSIATNEMFR